MAFDTTKKRGAVLLGSGLTPFPDGDIDSCARAYLNEVYFCELSASPVTGVLDTLAKRVAALYDSGLTPYPNSDIDICQRAYLVHVYYCFSAAEVPVVSGAPAEEWQKSYIGKIHYNLDQLLNNINVSDGYNYTTGSIKENDFNKSTFPLYQVELVDDEGLLEADDPDYGAFSNKATFRIHCYNKLTNENDNSMFEINDILNNMTQDIKKMIGNNPSINKTVGEIYYRGSQREPSGNEEDIFMPVKLVVELDTHYNQSKLYPTSAAF